MLKFKDFITEDAYATMGNSGGMGAIVSAQPGASPGEQGSTGSGDIGSNAGVYMKSTPNLKKDKRKKLKKFKELNNFNPMNEDFEDNITYEMSGPPPKYLFHTKADFEEAMLKYGYHHTTLNKKTDMLIVAFEELGTLKCKKAEKYGIPVYTYEYAAKEMKNLGNTSAKYNL